MLTVAALDRFDVAMAAKGELLWPRQYWFTVESSASVRGLALELFHPEDALVVDSLRVEYRKDGEKHRRAHVLSCSTRAAGCARWRLPDAALDRGEDPHDTFNPFDVAGSLVALAAAGDRATAEVASIGFVARATKKLFGSVRLVVSALDSPLTGEATLPITLT